MKKIAFTLLAVSHDNNTNYLESCKLLASEILNQTNHDVIITTNNTAYFSEIQNSRTLIRDLPDNDVSLHFNGAFNYNLKYMCFWNIPAIYDVVIYVDCDIKLEGPSGEPWDNSVDEYISLLFDEYNWNSVGQRTYCFLEHEIDKYVGGEHSLFSHKFPIYGLDYIMSLGENMRSTKAPAEHFFMIKNSVEMTNTMYETWKELNKRYENNTNGNSAAHDALEIGIALKVAGYDLQEIPISEHQCLKLKFNGNKK
jgi:hypothetical protein